MDLISDFHLFLGFIIPLGTILACTWSISRYIGKLEERISLNKNDTNNLGQKLRRRDKEILRHVNYHCTYINDIENFLQKELGYQPHTKVDLGIGED